MVVLPQGEWEPWGEFRKGNMRMNNNAKVSEKCSKCNSNLNSGYIVGGGLGLAFYDNYDGRLFSKRTLTSILDYFRGKVIFRKGGVCAKACPNCREISFKY